MSTPDSLSSWIGGNQCREFCLSSGSFCVTIYGGRGHAFHPHRTIDPVVMAAPIPLRPQSVVSREVDPREAAVVTVGSVVAGITESIIPGETMLKINVRIVTTESRTRLLTAIERICQLVYRGPVFCSVF
jgi:metal-dependent amidase/aminoacylase/carboxypeptidase family protein